jgi:hypothetical protein
MTIRRTLFFALLLSFSAAAQESPALSEEEAAFQKVTQLAALTPNSAEFSQAWTDYVINFVGQSGDVDAAIERVMKGANEFRKEFRPGFGGSGGPPLSYFEMRELLRGIAAEALAEDDG